MSVERLVTTYTVLRICPDVQRADGEPISRTDKALALLTALESIGQEHEAKVSDLARFAAEAQNAWLIDVAINKEVICRVRLTP